MRENYCELIRSNPAVVFGIDAKGSPVSIDFKETPNLFIGGSSGSGKSSMMSTMLINLIMKSAEQPAEFVLIGEKAVDFIEFYNVKGLQIPVILNSRKTGAALEMYSQEINERLAKLALAGCRDIDSYNKKAMSTSGLDVMPRLYLFIDGANELVEQETFRFLDMILLNGRPAGVHLIVSSRDISTKATERLIKLFNGKCCFRTAPSDLSRFMGHSFSQIPSIPGEFVFTPDGKSHVNGVGIYFTDEETDEMLIPFKIPIAEKEIKEADNTTEFCENNESGVIESEKAMVEEKGIPSTESGLQDKEKANKIQRRYTEIKSKHKLNRETIKLLKGVAVVLAILLACVAWVDVLYRMDPDQRSGSVLITIFLLIIIARIRKAIKKSRVDQVSLSEIDYSMTGLQFESYVCKLLVANGYTNVRVTRGSGDFGIDVIACCEGHSYAFQCKKYSSNVGVSAVQEAYSGKQYYGCDFAVVLTNRYFTKAAKELARSTGVLLWDRDKLKKLRG